MKGYLENILTPKGYLDQKSLGTTELEGIVMAAALAALFCISMLVYFYVFLCMLDLHWACGEVCLADYLAALHQAITWLAI